MTTGTGLHGPQTARVTSPCTVQSRK
jgi:hypothetical protein